MSLYKYGSSSKVTYAPPGRTEFEILKASHKFLRDDSDKQLSWDDQLAQKYYNSLYREFAVCDLKHYKSGNFALRWRTEPEVLSGAGESTCGNTRCVHHHEANAREPMPPLTTLELPFVYQEQAETKSALVKVVLCSGCVKKLMWKRRKEKADDSEVEKQKGSEKAGLITATEIEEVVNPQGDEGRKDSRFVEDDAGKHQGLEERSRHERVAKDLTGKQPRHRTRHSRSRSPRERSSCRSHRRRHSRDKV